MAAPDGAIETPSGYPIIDPDTINPQQDWPNVEQAQADWLDTHSVLRFASKAALLIARPSMPPGQSGFAFTVDSRILWQWTGSAWEPFGRKRVESGVTLHAYAGGVGPVERPIVFTTPFAAVPALTLSCNSPALQLYYGGLSTAGASVFSTGFNGVAPASASYSVSWIAVGS